MPTESSDEITDGLHALARFIANAQFYIKLDGDGVSSGFYAQGRTRQEAREEADAHLRRYPCWTKATVQAAHRGKS